MLLLKNDNLSKYLIENIFSRFVENFYRIGIVDWTFYQADILFNVYSILHSSFLSIWRAPYIVCYISRGI